MLFTFAMIVKLGTEARSNVRDALFLLRWTDGKQGLNSQKKCCMEIASRATSVGCRCNSLTDPASRDDDKRPKRPRLLNGKLLYVYMLETFESIDSASSPLRTLNSIR